ncbi:MAG TPA: DedA family protein [Gaiellaceae bacterium]|nr:DedA family protein [Gaiellaceae bacterium]
MPVASVLSHITDLLTALIGDHGLYAVFLLMLLDAVFPAASELVMVYAGAVAAGAFAGQGTVLFGHRFDEGLPAYLAMATAGSVGYTVGAVLGWWIGAAGGRPFLERHGRWVHLNEKRLARAEAWFERWGALGVFVGRVSPVVRSFVSIPAGVFRQPLGLYTALTLLGSTLWCFAFAAAGWWFGSRWEEFHHAFRYVEYGIAALIALALAYLAWRLVRRRRTSAEPGYTDAS